MTKRQNTMNNTTLSANAALQTPMAASTPILGAINPDDYTDTKINLVINYLSEAKYKELSANHDLCADLLYLTDAI